LDYVLGKRKTIFVIARELITATLPAVLCSDTGAKALDIMESFKVMHLPLLKNNEYVGLLSEKDIYDFDIQECCVGAGTLTLMAPSVTENQHIFEIAQKMNELQVSVMPVLDLNKAYLGAITLFDLASNFSKLVSTNEPGAIIVLVMTPADYSLSQIAQIIESNDSKVLSLYVSNEQNTFEIDVTIKVNVTDISAIIQTFVRYDYNIKAVYMDDSLLTNMYAERYEMFLKYMAL
jgi:acetoin utilization protein AcuB